MRVSCGYHGGMSAAYALPGDVIQVKFSILALAEDGTVGKIRPGCYGIAGQFGDTRLSLATVAQREDGGIVGTRPVYVVAADVLHTAVVVATPLKISRWVATRREELLEDEEFLGD